MKNKITLNITMLIILNIFTLCFMQSLGMFVSYHRVTYHLFSDTYYSIVACFLWFVGVLTNFIYLRKNKNSDEFKNIINKLSLNFIIHLQIALFIIIAFKHPNDLTDNLLLNSILTKVRIPFIPILIIVSAYSIIIPPILVFIKLILLECLFVYLIYIKDSKLKYIKFLNIFNLYATLLLYISARMYGVSV